MKGAAATKATWAIGDQDEKAIMESSQPMPWFAAGAMTGVMGSLAASRPPLMAVAATRPPVTMLRLLIRLPKTGEDSERPGRPSKAASISALASRAVAPGLAAFETASARISRWAAAEAEASCL